MSDYPRFDLGHGVSVGLDPDYNNVVLKDHFHTIIMSPEQCDNFTTWLREQRGTATDDD